MEIDPVRVKILDKEHFSNHFDLSCGLPEKLGEPKSALRHFKMDIPDQLFSVDEVDVSQTRVDTYKNFLTFGSDQSKHHLFFNSSKQTIQSGPLSTNLNSDHPTLYDLELAGSLGYHRNHQDTLPSGFIMAGLDHSTTTKPAGYFWNLQTYSPYFDVSTEEIKKRLILSLTPWSSPEQLLWDSLSSTEGNMYPDLYGPLWICLTFLLILAISSNCANHIRHYQIHSNIIVPYSNPSIMYPARLLLSSSYSLLNSHAIVNNTDPLMEFALPKYSSSYYNSSNTISLQETITNIDDNKVLYGNTTHRLLIEQFDVANNPLNPMIWKPRFDLVSFASITVLSVLFIPTSLIWSGLIWLGTKRHFNEVLSLIGYSLTSFIVAAIVCALPIRIIQWIAQSVAGLSAARFVGNNLKSELYVLSSTGTQHQAQIVSLGLLGILIIYLLMCVFLKYLFF